MSSTIFWVVLSVVAFWVSGIRSRADLICLVLRRLIPLIPSLVSAAKRHIPDDIQPVLEKITPATATEPVSKPSKAKK